MGRPVNKRYFGSLNNTDGGTMPNGDASYNIRVEAYVDGAAVDDAYILAQKGTNKFRVANKAGTEFATCRLKNKAATALTAGEMVIFGSDGSGNRITIKKLFNRTAVDWNGNRYTWVIEEDSTETIMMLTAI